MLSRPTCTLESGLACIPSLPSPPPPPPPYRHPQMPPPPPPHSHPPRPPPRAPSGFCAARTAYMPGELLPHYGLSSPRSLPPPHSCAGRVTALYTLLPPHRPPWRHPLTSPPPPHRRLRRLPPRRRHAPRLLPRAHSTPLAQGHPRRASSPSRPPAAPSPHRRQPWKQTPPLTAPQPYAAAAAAAAAGEGRRSPPSITSSTSACLLLLKLMQQQEEEEEEEAPLSVSSRAIRL